MSGQITLRRRETPIVKRDGKEEGNGRVRGPKVFKPFLTVKRNGEITLDRRAEVWRDGMLSGSMVRFPWTSHRDGRSVGPGDRREDVI